MTQPEQPKEQPRESTLSTVRNLILIITVAVGLVTSAVAAQMNIKALDKQQVDDHCKIINNTKRVEQVEKVQIQIQSDLKYIAKKLDKIDRKLDK